MEFDRGEMIESSDIKGKTLCVMVVFFSLVVIILFVTSLEYVVYLERDCKSANERDM